MNFMRSSHFALVLFIVDLELRRAAYGFVVPRVRDLPRHRQHDRFVHLVADDTPDVRSSLFILAHTFPSAPFWFLRSLCGAASNAWGSLSPHGLLESQVEQFFLQICRLGLKLLFGQISHFTRLGLHPSPPARRTSSPWGTYTLQAGRLAGHRLLHPPIS